jgi:LacI family transcriptional regulator
MKNKERIPTMKDVAAEAGVALGTVSKVFNGFPVGESYRIRVEQAAKKLGYRVNNYARGMRTNQTNTISIIMPMIYHPFFSKLTECIIRELDSHNYNSFVSVTDRNPQAEARCIRMVAQNKTDGIIALTYDPDFNNIGNIPFVSIDRSFTGSCPCITSDNYTGGQIAAAKLHELGCRKLLYARTGSPIPGETDKRGYGFENWCQTNSVSYDIINAKVDNDQMIEKIREMVENSTFDYDGIFCSTDLLLILIRNELNRLGIRVPEDVQMIGFDGSIDFFTGLPVCSSIEQPIEQLAKVAVNTILNYDSENTPSLICLPVRYIPGPTTKDWI